MAIKLKPLYDKEGYYNIDSIFYHLSLKRGLGLVLWNKLKLRLAGVRQSIFYFFGLRPIFRYGKMCGFEQLKKVKQ